MDSHGSNTVFDRFALKKIKEFARVPIIANGDAFGPDQIRHLEEQTGVDGVMCARGLLANPALFEGHDTVPLQCVIDYLEFGLQYGGVFNIHHHHLLQMLDRHLCRSERVQFNRLVRLWLWHVIHGFSHTMSSYIVVVFEGFHGWCYRFL